MGNSHRKKYKFDDNSFMDSRRNFGSPSGQIVSREPITPDLFMKVGTRVGTITAYYQHVQYNTNTNVTKSINTSNTSVVQTSCVNKLPELEITTPLPDPVVYDVPKRTQ